MMVGVFCVEVRNDPTDRRAVKIWSCWDLTEAQSKMDEMSRQDPSKYYRIVSVPISAAKRGSNV